MEEVVRKAISATPEEMAKIMDTFQEEYATKTTFPELSNNLREKFWEILFTHLENHSLSSSHLKCLSTMKILSRDKTNLDQILRADRLDAILETAGLTKLGEEFPYTSVTIESLKLLCNLLFNSTNVQNTIPKTQCLPCVVECMRRYRETVPYEVKLFHTRILLLITLLNKYSRWVVQADLKGDVCLMKLLEDTCLQCQGTPTNASEAERNTLACDVLKVLFNLYQTPEYVHSDGDGRMRNLARLVYRLLVLQHAASKDDLVGDITHLMIVIPRAYYMSFTPPALDGCPNKFQNVDMSAVSVLLKFLDRRLDCKEDLQRNLMPIVGVFIELVGTQKPIRRYVRLQILPPLKDVMKRPEEGTSLRAKLCKLLTSPVTQLRDHIAEFLFILCKENVSRMVKYTGYGNAAGMLANKGLLGPNRRDPANSSESEDSDTEEYLEHKEQINPVTGCFEPPKPNPLEGMTEEQKEYEAMQLVSLVQKLTTEGLIQPCRIGEDGKPRPITHVLELQEQLPKQRYARRGSESD